MLEMIRDNDILYFIILDFLEIFANFFLKSSHWNLKWQ